MQAYAWAQAEMLFTLGTLAGRFYVCLLFKIK